MKAPKFLIAIDPSTTSLGVALFTSGKLKQARTFRGLPKNERSKRQRQVTRQLLKWLEEMSLVPVDQPEMFDVACEDPMLQGRANQAMQRVIGALEEAIGTPFFFIHPMTVKRVLKHGSADKPAVLKACQERLAHDPKAVELLEWIKDEKAYDESDAVAVGLAYFQLKEEQEQSSTKDKRKGPHAV
jgi:Holliday junction resolvasome RuvABC endonuclease subunit